MNTHTQTYHIKEYKGTHTVLYNSNPHIYKTNGLLSEVSYGDLVVIYQEQECDW